MGESRNLRTQSRTITKGCDAHPPHQCTLMSFCAPSEALVPTSTSKPLTICKLCLLPCYYRRDLPIGGMVYHAAKVGTAAIQPPPVACSRSICCGNICCSSNHSARSLFPRGPVALPMLPTCYHAVLLHTPIASSIDNGKPCIVVHTYCSFLTTPLGTATQINRAKRVFLDSPTTTTQPHILSAKVPPTCPLYHPNPQLPRM